jgi:PAS domain S-box-containing protein
VRKGVRAVVAVSSLFPLTASILSAMLALLSALVPGRRGLAILYFILFNVATATWTLTYFVQLNWGRYADPALAPWGVRLDSLLLVLIAFSVSAAPTYWFLFAAAESHRTYWLSGPGLALAHVPMLYTVIVGLTNPWHHLFLRLDSAGRLAAGPLAIPYYLITFGFVGAGTWLLIRHSLTAGTAQGRRQALVLGLAPFVLLAGAGEYALRLASGASRPFNPLPGLFAVLSLILAYEIVRTGLADIVPLSTLSSIMENTDAPLAYLDLDFAFVSVNSAFARRSGHVEAELFGKQYFALFPDPSLRPIFEAVKRTGEPAERKADQTMLRDRAERDLSYWNWSLSAVKDGRGGIEGFVLSLVDVTDEVVERDLRVALDEVAESLHVGFVSDETLCRAVSTVSARLGCESSAIVLQSDDGLRMAQRCERDTVRWEPFDADVYQHVALAMRGQTPVVFEDASADDRVSPSLMAALGVRAGIVAPLLFEREAVGALAFTVRSGPRRFSRVQVDFVQTFASAVTAAVENRRVYEGERRIAETLQESMLSMPEAVDGIDFAHRYRSATETARVGGDFYDLFELEDGRIAVLIGDIAGHGIEAAVATSLVKNTIRAHALDNATPTQIMERTNEIVRRQMEPGQFATACLTVLDRRTGSVSYCNAGHPPTLVKTAGGPVVTLSEHSTILGIVPDVHYPEAKARLAHGDVLVLYTDGVIEARRDGGMFGEERLVGLLAEGPADEPADVVDRIYADVMSYSRNELSDDVALLALRLAEPAGT